MINKLDSKVTKVNVKLFFIFLIISLLTQINFTVNAQDTTDIEINNLDKLIDYIENNIDYCYCRRYSSYLIDTFLLENIDLIPKINIHENELQYIQIEDLEQKTINELREKDFEYNNVLSDSYYKYLIKPYSYIYLGFNIITDECQGFFTYHYFKKVNIDNLLTEFENIKSSLETTYNKSYTNDNGQTIEINENNDFWLNITAEETSLYELKLIKNYGIFYRKINIEYLYNYIIKYAPEEYELDISTYIYELINNINENNKFNPTSFILDEFRRRG